MLFDPSIQPTSPRARRRPPRGQHASAVVIPSLSLRPDQPAPSAAPCLAQALLKPPCPALRVARGPHRFRRLLRFSVIPHSCAAGPAPSNQSPTSRAVPFPRASTSPTATNPRKCDAISLPGASKKRARVRPITPTTAPRSFAQSRRATQPVSMIVGLFPAPHASAHHTLYFKGLIPLPSPPFPQDSPLPGLFRFRPHRPLAPDHSHAAPGPISRPVFRSPSRAVSPRKIRAARLP